MARIGAYMYVAGALAALVVILPPNEATANELGIAAAAVTGLVLGVLVLVLLDRTPPWLLPTLVLAASALITLAIYFHGQGDSAIAILYLWVAVYSFYFFGWRMATAMMASVGILYALVLLALETPDAPERWFLRIGTLTLLGLLVGALRRRVETLWSELSAAARTDGLTGLLNRRAFDEAFESEVERARRTERELSLMLVDLDHFKRVNDRLGHAAGDAALRRVAEILTADKRAMDTVARIGGEEFALLMPESRSRAAYVAAERLRGAIRGDFADEELSLTASIGVATFPNHGGKPRELMAAADRALYAAKELGRDRSVIYSQETDAILGGTAVLQASNGGGQIRNLLSLARALDAREGAFARHSEMVSLYAEGIARELGLPPERVERVRLAGALHDLGKIAVPDAVLRGTRPLEEHRSPELRMHPELGARLLAGEELADIRGWVLAHHERPDGQGFPNGLRLDEIPAEARIIAVADAFEALSGGGSRDREAEVAAVAELRREAGAAYDSRVVEALANALRRGLEGRPLD